MSDASSSHEFKPLQAPGSDYCLVCGRPDGAEVHNDARRSAALRDLTVAADRMRDDWAESDDAGKRRLWSNLHTAAESVYDVVYPL
jgi:hypothetical protein